MQQQNLTYSNIQLYASNSQQRFTRFYIDDAFKDGLEKHIIAYKKLLIFFYFLLQLCGFFFYPFLIS